MKRLQIFVLVMIVILVFGFNAYSTVTSVGESSEWEATGFNNGRRVVRDSSSVDMGYYHHVWHSQANPRERPSGRDCDIYYACTDDTGRVIFGPVNMTGNLRFIDNRYPSIAIENKGIDSNGKWRLLNNIHLVWQCKTEENYSYDVYHAVIKVNGRTPAPFTHSDLDNLSVTKKNNSLVPAVAINRYYDPSPQSGQNIHVVWQEEEATGPDTESDIYYTRSPDSGKTFTGPQSGGRWDNITNSERNSQMPSISCALDTFQGFPLESGGKDCNYNSKEVHVAYNETIQCNRINVFYLHSLTNGGSWITPQNVSGSSGDPECSYIDMYPSIAADMRDNVHIVFMRRKAHEDDTPRIEYIPGVNPTDNESFPGPDPRMYGGGTPYHNWIVYWSNSPNPPSPPSGVDMNKDQEFPT
ncbi:MAG: hypothetical protein GY940_16345, partial [bacterium]|nr:hypothetical protein [bacterium]